MPMKNVNTHRITDYREKTPFIFETKPVQAGWFIVKPKDVLILLPLNY
jgi:hypothetical protein